MSSNNQTPSGQAAPAIPARCPHSPSLLDGLCENCYLTQQVAPLSSEIQRCHELLAQLVPMRQARLDRLFDARLWAGRTVLAKPQIGPRTRCVDCGQEYTGPSAGLQLLAHHCDPHRRLGSRGPFVLRAGPVAKPPKLPKSKLPNSVEIVIDDLGGDN
jgi:hypothetical protein